MLIDRDAAIKAVQDYGITAINAGRKSLDVVDDIVELVRKIQDISTADAVPVVRQWIPVTERLPEPKENPVLVVYIGCVWAAWKHDNYWELVPGLNTTCVTHWMPMPEPPKGE